MNTYCLRLGWHRLWQHGRRNIIAGVAIAMSFFSIMGTIGYATRTNIYQAVSAMYVQQPGHVAIVKKDGLRKRIVDPQNYSLSASDISQITSFTQGNPEIDFVSPYLFSSGLVGSGCKSFPFIVRGFDVSQEQKVLSHPELRSVIPEYKAISKGVNLWDSQLTAPLVLSLGLAMKLGKSADSPVADASFLFTAEDCNAPGIKEKLRKDRSVQLLAQDFENRLNAVEAEVSGEFSTGLANSEDHMMRAPLSLLQDLLRTDKVSYLAVFLKDRAKAKTMAQTIPVKMREQGVNVEAYAWDDEAWNPNYVAGANVMLVSEAFVSFVVGMVVLLSILNTLTISLAESRVEIGTLRAIGYKPKEIANIFGVESFLTACFGALFGALISAGMFRMIEILKIPMQFPGFSQSTFFIVTPPSWSYLVVGASLCTMVTGTSLILSRRYARLSILKLLDKGG